MVNISQYIKSELIVPDLKPDTKENIIRQLAEHLVDSKPACLDDSLTAEELFASLMDRENSQNTGLGNGVAFPHARIDKSDDFACVIGYCKDGFDYASRDGKPCHLVCLMVSCIDKPYIILQVMADLARMICDNGIDLSRGDFTRDELRALIVENIMVKHGQILAKDVMRPVNITVNINDSVQAAARTMHLSHKDILPVLDRHLEGLEQGYEAEHRMRHKDGRWIWILSKGQVVERFDDGRSALLRRYGSSTSRVGADGG